LRPGAVINITQWTLEMRAGNFCTSAIFLTGAIYSPIEGWLGTKKDTRFLMKPVFETHGKCRCLAGLVIPHAFTGSLIGLSGKVR